MPLITIVKYRPTLIFCIPWLNEGLDYIHILVTMVKKPILIF